MLEGYHNQNMQKSFDRLQKGRGYEDLSTVCIIPTRGHVHMKVLMSWMNLQKPMNQRFMWMPIIGMEVGEAYEQAISQIIAHPELSKWKYVMTLEEDNCPPPDGLLKLYESIKDYDAVGGLYWTKGEGGQPMCYGNVHEAPKSFRPQLVADNCLTPCNGLGMGFNLFRMSIFKDKKFERPFFKTLQGSQGCMTQDLYFFEKAGRQGYKFACDSRVKVGHYDAANDMMW